MGRTSVRGTTQIRLSLPLIKNPVGMQREIIASLTHSRYAQLLEEPFSLTELYPDPLTGVSRPRLLAHAFSLQLGGPFSVSVQADLSPSVCSLCCWSTLTRPRQRLLALNFANYMQIIRFVKEKSKMVVDLEFEIC